ncbi:MAG: caspase family protein [Planctomycetes bacterium]|nr:caspase family protein [Planctomycetota bacterium]
MLVAAQNYDSRSFGPLPNACAEIREIDGALDRLGYAQRMLVCDDAPDAGRKPRKANIQRALAETVAAAGPEDTLFILVSLHGLVVEGNVYLCPLDVCDRRFDPGRIDEVAISVQAVYRQLKACRAKHKILILEICRTEAGKDFTLFARVNAPVYKPGVGTPYGTIFEVTGAAEATGASEATPDESTGQQGKPQDDAEKKAPDNEYCRVVVKRIAGSGKGQWMNVVIHDLGGEPITAWVQASDVMWSSDLAEYYWISSGMRSQRYRNAVAVIQTKVQRIHTAIGAYDTVARLLSMGGIPLPSIGGYAQMAEQAIRRTVHSRIAIRRGTVYGLVGREYIDTWWRLQQRFLEQQLSPPVEGAKSTILFQD